MNQTAINKQIERESFQKPFEICRKPLVYEHVMLDFDSKDFANNVIKVLLEELNAKQISIRNANINDIDILMTLFKQNYNQDVLDEVTGYDLYRCIMYGNGLILYNIENQIVGCIFEIGYDNPSKISYNLRLTINKNVNGQGLGLLLSRLSLLIAMRRGSYFKKGLMETDNYTTLYLHLNEIGGVIAEYHDEPQGQTSCFDAVLHLTPKGYCQNRTDRHGLTNFLKNNKEGFDYRIANLLQKENIEKQFADGKFLGVAYLSPKIYFKEPSLLLLPREILKFNFEPQNDFIV